MIPLNLQAARAVGAAWNAGNCCLIGDQLSSSTVVINTPLVFGSTALKTHGAPFPPPALNDNRPDVRPVA